MIHTPLAGDSMRTCLPANSLPKEICPLAPMDLTILLSVAGLDIALSLKFMHSCCMIVSEKLIVNLDVGLVELHAGAEA